MKLIWLMKNMKKNKIKGDYNQSNCKMKNKNQSISNRKYFWKQNRYRINNNQLKNNWSIQLRNY